MYKSVIEYIRVPYIEQQSHGTGAEERKVDRIMIIMLFTALALPKMLNILTQAIYTYQLQIPLIL